MQLHELRPLHKAKKAKRVGRGGKRGTYSGRGMKGQLSRAGRKLQPMVRESVKRYPKKKGYKQRLVPKSGKKETVILNLDILENKFNAGEKVSPEILLEKKMIEKVKGKIPRVKILGKGDITKKLIIEGCDISKKAKKKIEEKASLKDSLVKKSGK